MKVLVERTCDFHKRLLNKGLGSSTGQFPHNLIKCPVAQWHFCSPSLGMGFPSKSTSNNSVPYFSRMATRGSYAIRGIPPMPWQAILKKDEMIAGAPTEVGVPPNLVLLSLVFGVSLRLWNCTKPWQRYGAHKQTMPPKRQ